MDNKKTLSDEETRNEEKKYVASHSRNKTNKRSSISNNDKDNLNEKSELQVSSSDSNASSIEDSYANFLSEEGIDIKDILSQLKSNASLLEGEDDRQNIIENCFKQFGLSLQDINNLETHNYQKILKSLNDPETQILGIDELSRLISFSNVDTLSSFPIENFLPVLMTLMEEQHNPELVSKTIRTLNNIMEVYPTCLKKIGTYSDFLIFKILATKLYNIEYIDVAEEAVLCLNKLVKEKTFGESIVQSNVLNSLLMVMEFFDISIQAIISEISYFSICNIEKDSFHFIAEVIPKVSELLIHSNEKIAKYSCLFFVSLTHSFMNDHSKIDMLSHSQTIERMLSILKSHSCWEKDIKESLKITNCFNSAKYLFYLCLCSNEIKKELLIGSNYLTYVHQLLTFYIKDTDYFLQPRHQRPILQLLHILCELLPSLNPFGTCPLQQSPHWQNLISLETYETSTVQSNDLFQESSLIRFFLDTCLTTIYELFNSTTNYKIKQQCLHVILKIFQIGMNNVTSLPFDTLFAVRFISSLLINKTLIPFILFGLLMMEAMICFEFDWNLFEKEGIFYELVFLQNITFSSSSWIKCKISDSVCQENTQNWIRETSKKILLNQSKTTITIIQSKLNLIAQNLFDNTNISSSLNNLNELLHETSSFQLSVHNIWSSLLSLLNSFSIQKENLNVFYKVFYQQSSIGVSRLVQLLHDSLDRMNFWDESIPFQFSNLKTKDPLEFVLSPIRIVFKLKETQKAAWKTRSFIPLDTVQDLKDFLLKKMKNNVEIVNKDTENVDDSKIPSNSTQTDTKSFDVQLYYQQREIMSTTTLLEILLNDNSSRSGKIWTFEYLIKDNTELSELDPTSLSKTPFTFQSSFLVVCRILAKLFQINSHNEMSLSSHLSSFPAIPLTEFLNKKLNSKICLHLENPFIVGASDVPPWCIELVKKFPFLLSLETRTLFLRVISFGNRRAILHIIKLTKGQDSNRLVSRIKVLISRDNLFENGIFVTKKYMNMNSFLEVEYVDEAGSGLGPTLEFFSLFSKQFRKNSLGLWKTDSSDFYLSPLNGLFPMVYSNPPEHVLEYFEVLGTMCAKALLDCRLVDIIFHRIFWLLCLNQPHNISFGDFLDLDKNFFQSIKYLTDISVKYVEFKNNNDVYQLDELTALVRSISLSWNFPGHPDLLFKNTDKTVEVYELNEYIDYIFDYYLDQSCKQQIDSFVNGWNKVFPIQNLSLFSPEEITSFLSGVNESWTINYLSSVIKIDHGYTLESPSIQHLFSIMCSFSMTEQQAFLKFLTGSFRLPVGGIFLIIKDLRSQVYHKGLKSLMPPLTVVRKGVESNPDEYLPSVMTCVNYLKLPDYSSLEKMEKQIRTAICEGSDTFLLS